MVANWKAQSQWWKVDTLSHEKGLPSVGQRTGLSPKEEVIALPIPR